MEQANNERSNVTYKDGIQTIGGEGNCKVVIHNWQRARVPVESVVS